ncbi:ComEA family DNA-binding protein [Algibacter luteus]|uniref:Competence protein ComEA helix-hairpin-helix repeat region n=1 Tax=Algibacter luteus TaxID=1178825 RepID=A0A1M6H3J8_9FLAO|nr:helix-hairpin-helix domain-containing protein [Algibacter luteus]SHJ16781.1 competence protein ComEA helix-hairpin-helix repeat region [Algibacter luteus]
MKSQFTFTKQQRNGIFLMLTLIITFQCIYFFVDFTSEEVSVDEQQLSEFIKEIDSLKIIELQERVPKIYPFNPNYLTDFKGASLGMTNEEIDRLLRFRNQNKWINTAEQFQEVTQVSDSLLAALSVYFKFPEWVTSSKPSKERFLTSSNNKPKTYAQKQDLNTATAQDLQNINGIGKTFSERIIKYRNKLKGGFIADVQLEDIYGLTPELIEKITNQFTVKTPNSVNKINVNKASSNELVKIPHIDYELAYNIIEQRKLRQGFNSIEELTKVKDFPLNKIKIIELYLHFEKEK